VTVLPVMLGAGAKRMRPKDPSKVAPSKAFAKWGTRITHRPALAAVAGGLALLVLASPVLALRLGQPDAGNDAKNTTTRKAYDKLAEGFGPGFNGQFVLAASVPKGAVGDAGLEKVRKAVEKTQGVAAVTPPQKNPAGDAATFTLIPTTSPQDAKTSKLVSRLRDDVLPGATKGTGVQVSVGGVNAIFQDLSDKVASRLPIFILLVVGLSILLLMAVFRSIWVPLVSAVFNLLSIGAAYGVVVAVFQWGWGASLLGIDGSVPIVSFVPLFMFAVLFGLSMDYNVFLQSRIREEFHRGATADESVVRGLSRVAKIILAAGAIMTAVFLGFASDPDVVVKTIGIGLASAILIDVLIVRLVVAPAVMALLGDRAWWFPEWLDRIVPKISLEGEDLKKEPAEEREPVAV
jgi:RND superfamily putative drug exporter